MTILVLETCNCSHTLGCVFSLSLPRFLRLFSFILLTLTERLKELLVAKAVQQEADAVMEEENR